jgi:hypothetical protein
MFFMTGKSFNLYCLLHIMLLFPLSSHSHSLFIILSNHFAQLVATNAFIPLSLIHLFTQVLQAITMNVHNLFILSITHCSSVLFVIYCSLFIIHYLLSIIYCSLFIVHTDRSFFPLWNPSIGQSVNSSHQLIIIKTSIGVSIQFLSGC